MSWVALANLTLSNSSSSSITFSNINQSYRDLFFVYNGETVSSGAEDLGFTYNGGANNAGDLFGQILRGDGSSASGYSYNFGRIMSLGSGVRSIVTANIMDYSATDKHKSNLIRFNSSSWVALGGHRWASTNAITSITFSIGAGTFASGSTFALYGVSA